MLRIDPAILAAEPARALIERQLALLTCLADIGMGVAEAAGRAAEQPQAFDAGARPDPALAYARAARAVRMTIALQSRLLQDLAGFDRADGLAATGRAHARRDRVYRLVERAVEAGRGDEEEIERLSSEAWERLADRDDADIAGRPLAEIIVAICKDLGLSPEESAWAVSQVADGAAEPPFTAPPGALNPGLPPAGPPPLTAAASARPGARSRASPAIGALGETRPGLGC